MMPARQQQQQATAGGGDDGSDQFDMSSLFCHVLPDLPKSFNPAHNDESVEVEKLSPKGNGAVDPHPSPKEQERAPLLSAASSSGAATTTSQNAGHDLKLFYPDEIVRGKVLGKGTFGCVYEVSQFQPLSEYDPNFNDDCRALRRDYSYLAQPGKYSKYAVKTLHDAFADAKTERPAVQDIRHEVTLLQTLDHPHIIRMHAASAAVESRNMSPRDCFIVLDRLTGTLNGKLSRWKSEKKRAKGDRKKQLLCQRMSVASDVASALAYLHSHRIIYRDLKQDNVGFNVEGKCILFDFGLARELPQPAPPVANENQVEPPPEVAPNDSTSAAAGTTRNDDKEVWVMSGRTGSLPFMAPEVYHRDPYNAKADVYSMSVLLWVVVAMELPYMELARDIPNLTHKVMNEGYRPPMKEKKWPGLLVKLFKDGWSPDHTMRPSMEEFCVRLKEVIKSESVPSVKARTIKRSFFM